jgi:hypothetical protein
MGNMRVVWPRRVGWPALFFLWNGLAIARVILFHTLALAIARVIYIYIPRVWNIIPYPRQPFAPVASPRSGCPFPVSRFSPPRNHPGSGSQIHHLPETRFQLSGLFSSPPDRFRSARVCAVQFFYLGICRTCDGDCLIRNKFSTSRAYREFF